MLYQVKPKSIPRFEQANHLPTPEDRAKASASMGEIKYGVGCVVMGIIALMVTSNIVEEMRLELRRPYYTGNPIICLGCVIGLPLLLTKAIRAAVLRNRVQQVVRQRLSKLQQWKEEMVNQEATSATTQLQVIYDQQSTNLNSLHELINQSDSVLNDSENLYAERAYTPFWDSIESAMRLLKGVSDRVSKINDAAKAYYALLQGREHNFPAFPVKVNDLPSPDLFVQRLSRIVATAHRDFQFASIYEQRKTTNAVIAGFTNLQSAITGLRKDIIGSIAEFERSLDSGLRSLASGLDTLGDQQSARNETDVKHHEFVEKALDNIQHRRKPKS